MYKIIFYRDKNGKESIKEYLEELENRSIKSKDARIKKEKIEEYLNILEREGTRAGIPYTKHLDDNIWELRPLRDRFLFAVGKEIIYYSSSFSKENTKNTALRK